ncbi:MAG TPA: nitrate ABC transporter substrate-binding protein, partial [Terrimesophilobacter sp.]|nr:nitrate ABC transporter substrate-binding protein [Terrimesophilobacter sp.]
MRKSILLGVAALSVLALSACGTTAPTNTGDSDSGSTTPTKITVGVIPIVDTAPIWLGVKKGFFTDEGL